MITLISMLLFSCSMQDFYSSTLHIICEPECEVLINHEDVRISTPEENGVLYRDFAAGKYIVSVRKKGFLSESFVAEVGVDESYVRKVTLSKNNSSLIIRTIPRDCEITCDCIQLSTEKTEHLWVVRDVMSGKHTLSISSGDKSHNFTLSVEPDKHYYLDVDFLSGSLEPSFLLSSHDASSIDDTRWRVLDTQDDFPIKLFDSLTGITFLYVRGGSFEMGGHAASKTSGARPVHKVSVNDFYMAETEVTQEQWLKIMHFNPSMYDGNLLPVVGVSFEDCNEYLSLAGQNMRLPTEAEWEYACRAGTDGKYSFDKETLGIDDVAWHYGNSDGRMRRVARKLPNPWGFYDMHGNVMEWCSDRYMKKYYEISPRDNPQGPRKGMNVFGHVVRGGSWYHGVGSMGLKSYDRNHVSSSVKQDDAILNSRGYVLFATYSFLGVRPVIPAPLF